jgi:transglutaminase-like putative cysteine protease
VDETALTSMVFDITSVTSLLLPPGETRRLRFWIPVPQSDANQEVARLSVESPYPYRLEREPYWGNQMAFLEMGGHAEPFRVTIRYRVTRRAQGAQPLPLPEEERRKYLQPAQREAGNEEIRRFTDRIVGDTSDPYRIGEKVYAALLEYLTYDKVIPGCGMGDSIWTFEARRGRCDDFHALFRTMLLYRGVPVRWEQGIALPRPSTFAAQGELEGDCTAAHCWVVYHAGGKWVPVDLSEASQRPALREFFFGRLSPNRFKVSSGRDIRLHPPQGGAPLGTFPFAYAEGNGIPLIYGHHYRNRLSYRFVEMG